jgi:hypothetical protein
MNGVKALIIIDKCVARLEGVQACRNQSGGIIPSSDVALSHAAWMCEQARTFAETGKLDKANRWIGFIQGTLWMAGRATIDEMREDNR